VVEEARAAGMDSSNPRLMVAERNLAMRYQEIKELAAFAHKLGLDMGDEDDEDDEEEDGGGGMLTAVAAQEEAAHAALEKVQRLQAELDACVQELRIVDEKANPKVRSHPAFLQMREVVVEKLRRLHAELEAAREAWAAAQAQRGGRPALTSNSTASSADNALVASSSQMSEEEEEETDLSPMLRAALDKLWQRPYDCRVFVLQLLQSMAALDDGSLCMMASCFARYLDSHAVPA